MSTVLNPNNPHVLNEYYFLNSTDRYVYKESNLYIIRLINTSSVVILGSLLAYFVFFLIAKQSPDALKSYRKVLLLSAIVDLWMIVQIALVQTVRLKSKKSFKLQILASEKL
jgi:hypothetical protein